MKTAKKAKQLRDIGFKNSGKDSILAHITPQEAALLKARGGSGRIDPQTKLPHFDGGGDGGDSGDSGSDSGSAPSDSGDSGTGGPAGPGPGENSESGDSGYGEGLGLGADSSSSSTGDLGTVFGDLSGINYGHEGLNYSGVMGLDATTDAPVNSSINSDAMDAVDPTIFGKLSRGYDAIMSNPYGKGIAAALSFANPTFGAINGIMGLANAGQNGKGGQAMGAAFGSGMQSMAGPMGGLAGLAGLGLGNAMGQAMSGQGYMGDDAPGPYGNDATGVSGANAIGGLAGLYGMYKMDQGSGNYVGGLQNMYGPNSPYAQQLQQELERRDAAGGRRSQYGPRSVELQAALAKANAGVAPAIMQGQQNQFNNRIRMLQMLGNQMGRGGALNYNTLSGLYNNVSDWFSGGQQSFAPTNYGEGFTGGQQFDTSGYGESLNNFGGSWGG